MEESRVGFEPHVPAQRKGAKVGPAKQFVVCSSRKGRKMTEGNWQQGRIATSGLVSQFDTVIWFERVSVGLQFYVHRMASARSGLKNDSGMSLGKLQIRWGQDFFSFIAGPLFPCWKMSLIFWTVDWQPMFGFLACVCERFRWKVRRGYVFAYCIFG